MLRLCLATPGPWEEAVRLGARAGAWGVVLALPEGAGEAQAAAAGRGCREAGLAVACLKAAADVAAPESGRRAAAAGHLRRAMALAAAAGAPVVAADAGPAGPGAPVAVPGRDPLDRAAETLRAVLGPEGPGGVRLVLRTAAGTAVDSLLRASEAVRRVAHPAFGILLDPAELVTLDTYHDNPSFLRRAAAQLGSALWGCTARDVLLVPDGFAYRLEVAPLGAGALDYPGLLAEMARLPGDVPVCVAGPATEAEAALRHLRQVLDRAAARD